MNRVLTFGLLVFFGYLGNVQNLAAQDLVITNVRIIVGNGNVINQGSIVIRGGKLATVSATNAIIPGVQTVDAHGMTAMPGFIDAHRHINAGPAEKDRMQELLDAGYTTVLSGGGPAEGNIQLRQDIETGVIKGPRVIPSGTVNLSNSTIEQARAEVRRLAGLGIKFIGEEGVLSRQPPKNSKISARSTTRRRN
jgi:imidazolonepropionase-like amidohydrolase